MFLYLAKALCRVPSTPDPEGDALTQSPAKAVWCLRELMTYMDVPLEPVFDDCFLENATTHENNMKKQSVPAGDIPSGGKGRIFRGEAPQTLRGTGGS